MEHQKYSTTKSFLCVQIGLIAFQLTTASSSIWKKVQQQCNFNQNNFKRQEFFRKSGKKNWTIWNAAFSIYWQVFVDSHCLTFCLDSGQYRLLGVKLFKPVPKALLVVQTGGLFSESALPSKFRGVQRGGAMEKGINRNFEINLREVKQMLE